MKIVWHERISESKFVASVWSCSVTEETTRTAIADPCISLILVQSDSSSEVILRGPETLPREELLLPGYTWTAIRLYPGVMLQGFPAEKFINDALLLPADAEARFQFEGVPLQFPGYNKVELLIDQLAEKGFLKYDASREGRPHHQGMSSRSYARLTKRTVGLSPYKFQQVQRLHQALLLLKQGVPAATVAADLGFVDQAHFTRVVKQFLGHTPKEFAQLPQIPYDKHETPPNEKLSTG